MSEPHLPTRAVSRCLVMGNALFINATFQTLRTGSSPRRDLPPDYGDTHHRPAVGERRDMGRFAGQRVDDSDYAWQMVEAVNRSERTDHPPQ